MDNFLCVVTLVIPADSEHSEEELAEIFEALTDYLADKDSPLAMLDGQFSIVTGAAQ